MLSKLYMYLLTLISLANYAVMAPTPAEDRVLRERGAPLSATGIVMHKTLNNSYIMATCVLIHPEWIISAAHMLPYHDQVANTTYKEGGVQRIRMDGIVQFKQGMVEIPRAPSTEIDFGLISNNYRRLEKTDSYLQDITLCHLTKPIHHIKPIPLVTPEIFRTQKRDCYNARQMLICGRGTNRQGVGLLNSPSYVSDRYAFTGPVFTGLNDLKDKLNIPVKLNLQQSAWYMPTFKTNNQITSNPTKITLSNPWLSGLFQGKFDLTNSAVPLKGDSGSGVFIEHENQLYLAGIFSGSSFSQNSLTTTETRNGWVTNTQTQTGEMSFNRIEPLALSPFGNLLDWVELLFKETGLYDELTKMNEPNDTPTNLSDNKVPKPSFFAWGAN
jgi:hypothetical protein